MRQRYTMNPVLDDLIREGYAYLERVHPGSDQGISILAQARLGLLHYLSEQQSVQTALGDEVMQRVLAVCANYIVALYLFVCIQQQSATRRNTSLVLQRVEASLSGAYEQLLGIPRKKYAALAHASLNLMVLVAASSTIDHLIEQAFAMCIYHMSRVHYALTYQEEQHLQQKITYLARRTCSYGENNETGSTGVLDTPR